MDKTYQKRAPTLVKDIFDKRKYSQMEKIINKSIKSLEIYMNKLGKKKDLWDETFIHFLEIKDSSICKLLTGKDLVN